MNWRVIDKMRIRRKYKCDICKKRFHKEDLVWTQYDACGYLVQCKGCREEN